MAEPQTTYRTPPPAATPGPRSPRLGTLRTLLLRSALWTGLAVAAVLALLWSASGGGEGPDGTPLTTDARITLTIFATAVWAWAFTPLDDTFVALAAATGLVLSGVLAAEALFATLGDETIWLLVAAFVIAAGVGSSGLAARAACWLVTGARTVRGLAHLVSGALIVTTFAIPATSGRAALALPVFLVLAKVLLAGVDTSREERVVRMLAILFPTVILLSAVGSLLGAGAHLVTAQVLQTATGIRLDFADWLILGLPLAVVSSHVAAEVVLRLFLTRGERRSAVQVTLADLAEVSDTPVSGPLTVPESRAGLIMISVVVLWCTQSLHGIHPAIVALIGALVTTSPRFGSTRLKDSLATVPWSLLLFMAATLALGSALITSGAAEWVATALFSALHISTAWPFMVLVVVISTLAHLVIQSRSARSAVLVPIVVALAPAVGASPALAAFASTAAAGFCHTLPASAKPVGMFARIEGVPTYGPAELRRLSLVLAPVSAALVLLFTYAVWPLLGLGG